MSEETRSSTMSVPPPLLRFWCLLVIVTFASATWNFVLVRVMHVKAETVPVFILPNSVEVYHWDFTVFAERFSHFRKPGFWNDLYYPFVYPAATSFAFAFFYWFPWSVRVYLAFLSCVILAAAWLWALSLTQRGISALPAALFVITFVTSYPLRFQLQRANIEGIVVLFTAAAILAFFKRAYWLAATLIGLAGAMKIFPLILFGLLISTRKYKQFIWGIAVAAAANFGSLWLLGPSIALAQKHIAQGMATFERTYVVDTSRGPFVYDHSLFTLVKLPLIITNPASAKHLVIFAVPIYIATTALAGVLLFFLVIRKLPLLNQVLILTLCGVFLPPVSFDYTLLHLFIPFAMLSLYAVDRWKSHESGPAGLNAAMVLCGIIFADLNLLRYHYLIGPTRAFAMLLLLITLLRTPLRWQSFHQAQ